MTVSKKVSCKNLGEFIAEQEMSTRAFANELESTNRSSLQRLINGERYEGLFAILSEIMTKYDCELTDLIGVESVEE